MRVFSALGLHLSGKKSGGWMDGKMGGSKSCLRDCLQQSKNLSPRRFEVTLCTSDAEI